MSILVRRGAAAQDALAILVKLRIPVLDFDLDDAVAASSLTTPAALAAGLSFCDRACLGSGLHRRLKILTADRAWAIPGLGVKLEYIR